MMKSEAIFVNTARGRIVVEQDLVAALQQQRIAARGSSVRDGAAALDSPLRLLANVVLTPHAAGITREATEAGLAMAIDNVLPSERRPMHLVT